MTTAPHGKPHFTRFFQPSLRAWLLILAMISICRTPAQAGPISVRFVQGSVRGFLELRAEDGRVVAWGDNTQVVHGDRVTTETLFTFKDGSVDDEVTVFSQHRTFQLITYHRVQKGPYFPHPIDLTIDAHSGQVTVRSAGKNGKEEVNTSHVDLPSDLANGMVPLALENLRPGTPQTTVSILVATPKTRIVKIVLSKRAEETFSVGGSARKAIHYDIKVELGGVAGVVAPLVGKEPPNFQIWIIGGQAPSFLKEQGPLYPDGPTMTIQLASPVWPEQPKSGD